MIVSKGMVVNKQTTTKERMKTLELMSRFWIVLANIKESDMQCDKNHSNTGCNRSANHLPSSWWDEPVIISIRDTFKVFAIQPVILHHISTLDKIS